MHRAFDLIPQVPELFHPVLWVEKRYNAGSHPPNDQTIDAHITQFSKWVGASFMNSGIIERGSEISWLLIDPMRGWPLEWFRGSSIYPAPVAWIVR